MSTTTNLKLFKHDNPTTNTNQFDVEKALNGNWDKVDKNAGEVASKIQTLENKTNAKDTSQDAEIEVLKAENALLKSQIPSATVVGETIHLEDSSNMQCQIAPIGASKQETREGYNIVNSYASLTDTTQYNTIYYKNDKLEVSKTYTISFKGKVGDMYRIPSSEYGVAVENKIITIDNDGIGKATFTTKSEFTVNSAGILQNYSANNTLPLTDICIVEGTEAKPFEEYGASPSIEFEALIESVGDNINLLDLSNGKETDTKNGITATKNNDNTYTLNGTADTTGIANIWFLGSYNNTNILFTIPKGTYTVANIALFSYDGTTRKSLAGEIDGSNTYTLTEDFNVTAVRCPQLTKEQTYNDKIVYPKICKGTKATPYSPYEQGSIEIYNCNENLFNKNNVKNGYYSISNGALNTSSSDWYYSIIPAIKNKELTLSGVSTVNTSIGLVELDHSKNFIKGLSAYANKTFITSEECRYIGISCRVADIDTLKLEFGSTATEYIKGQSQTKALYTQQPFRTIGDVKDRFVKVDGVWYEEHKVTRKELVGNESWTRQSFQNQYYFRLQLDSSGQLKSDLGISTHLNFVKSSESILSYTYSFRITVGNLDIVLDKTSMSVDDFKALLSKKYSAGTPICVDYVLAEPLLIPCTPEQVEVLESFNTYKNITNISSDSIGKLEVTYLKDLETLLNNINQAVLGGN